MEKEIISSDIVKTNSEYNIYKTREKHIDYEGKQVGRIQTWYDVCETQEGEDIVYSSKKLKEAYAWANGNR